MIKQTYETKTGGEQVKREGGKEEGGRRKDVGGERRPSTTMT